MTLRFNPPKESGRYGLYIEGRQMMKLFNELGHAKLSYHFANYGFPDGKILENVDGQWYVLHEMKGITSYKELPWVKEVESGGWRSRSTYPRAVPMTREQYANWRVLVERERVANQGIKTYSV